jgi:DNA-directed RNA polymerase specialized sigma24 family protein
MTQHNNTSVEIKYTDSQLKALLAGGSEEALYGLYDMYSAALYATIIKLVYTKEQADDVLMKTFLQVQQQPQSFIECPFGLFIWLLRIAVKLCLEQKKANGTYMSREDLLAMFFPQRWPAIQQSRLEMQN